MATEDLELSGIQRLKGTDDFPMWEFEIKILFKAKQLYEIVNGEDLLESHNNNQEEKKKWKTKDARAQHYIIRTIDNQVKPHVLASETAKEMFDALTSIYKRDTSQQKCQLLTEFYNYRYDKDIDVMGNISHLQNIAFKLTQLNQEIDEMMLITKIMTILPDHYRHFGTAWDSAGEDNKTLENLTSRLCLEEERYKIGVRDEPTVAFSVSVKERNEARNIKCYNCGQMGHRQKQCKKQRRKKQCTYCGKENHVTENCWFKQKQDKDDACAYCGKTNHRTENCYFRKSHIKERTYEAKNATKSKEKPVFLAEIPMENYRKFDERTKRKDYTIKHKQQENTETLSMLCEKETTFVVDSGCSMNMTNDKELLYDIRRSNTMTVKVAKKGESMNSNIVGNIHAENMILTNVSFLPDLSRNLLSVNAITEKEGEVLFKKHTVEILKNGKVIRKGYKSDNGLYEMTLSVEKEAMTAETTVQTIDWHRKLGHINFTHLRRLSDMSEGIPRLIKHCHTDMNCDICCIAKQVRKPFNTVRYNAVRPLEIIHSDICGKIDPPTYNNKNYFLTCIDDYTHFVKVYLLEYKHEAETSVKEYILEAEAFFDKKVSKFRCDNGGEYRSDSFRNWCKGKGVILDYTVPHSPQLNGKAERMNLTLMNKTRALLYDSKLHSNMWGEAVLTAAYLQNRSPTSDMKITPAEAWYGRKPDLSNLQVFGSKVYCKTLGKLKKLESRSKEGILNGYRIWDSEQEKTYISRDITVMTETDCKTENTEMSQIEYQQTDDEDDCQDEEQPNEDGGRHEEVCEQEEEHTNDENVRNENACEQKLNTKRERRLPKKFKDFVMDNEEVLMTYEECMESKDKIKWRTAIDEEKQCLDKNNTWELVDEKQTKGKEIITSRWIFKEKENGKYKARLVARGFQQKEGLDFKDTFSSVIHVNSLRVLLAIAAQEEMHIMTFDIKSAFLHGDLQEEVYMYLPQGYEEEEGKVCLLKKALYGLRQAPLSWNKRLTDFLIKEGMTQLKSDQCVFLGSEKEPKQFVGIHVDDGIVIGKSKRNMQCLMKKLQTEFGATINEGIEIYLGMEIQKTDEGISVKQSKYTRKTIEKYNMQESKPVKTPIADQDKREEVTQEKFPYREAVGSLLYLSCKTRPDISYAVNYESRHVECPNKQDIVNVKRTLRYLKGSMEQGIAYTSLIKTGRLTAYCDSDFGGDKKDRKSTSGYIIMYADGPIVWNSKKQSVVALSSTEAEYMAVAHCCRELKHIRTLMKELLNKDINVDLYVDNQSCIKMIKSGQMSRNSNHIDIKYHFISDEYNKGWFELLHCSTTEQLADIMTKPLQRIKYETCSLKFMSMG